MVFDEDYPRNAKFCEHGPGVKLKVYKRNSFMYIMLHMSYVMLHVYDNCWKEKKPKWSHLTDGFAVLIEMELAN